MASSPANGVRWIRIRLSKNTLVQFVSKKFPATFKGSLVWGSAAKLKLGPHWITVTVTDKLGNISTKRTRIWRVKATHNAKRHQRLVHGAIQGLYASPRGTSPLTRRRPSGQCRPAGPVTARSRCMPREARSRAR